MSFPTTLLIPKLNNSLINLNNLTDNNLNHKQSINLYCKNQFHSIYKINEQILKNLIHKLTCQKRLIYYKKFKTSNLIISYNSCPPTRLLHRTYVIYLFKCPLGDCVSKENMLMLVLPLQLFPDNLQCTLMTPVLLPFILRTILFLNPNFEKF